MIIGINQIKNIFHLSFIFRFSFIFHFRVVKMDQTITKYLKRKSNDNNETKPEDEKSKKIKKIISIAIIGTSGRKQDKEKMSEEVWKNMISKAEEIVTKDLLLDWKEIKLISGGAALADHIAIALFLKHGCFLKLELPCEWDEDKSQFYDSGEYDWKQNPGKTLNYYHAKFSKACNLNSLDDIQECYYKGVEIIVTPGFFVCTRNLLKSNDFIKNRNMEIAKSDIALAFTFSEKDPKDGGTAHTWSKFDKKTLKRHVCISNLK